MDNEQLNTKTNSKKGFVAWFKSLKKSTKIILCSTLSIAVAAGVAIPIYFTFFNKRIISSNIEDLIPEQQERELVLENANISNTKVILNEDFDTVITVKDEIKEDVAINNVKVFVYKETNNNQLNASNEKRKVELEKDKDYTLTNEGSKASLKVLGKAITDKIALSITFKEISFNRIVSFEDVTIPYDGNEHEFKITLKEGKSLPEGTSIEYSYGEKKQLDPFKFSDAGKYEVKVTLSKEEYKTYTKTATFNISKIELPVDKKDEIKFIKTSCKETELVTPEIENNSGIDFLTAPTILYKVNNNWTDVAPTTFGEYPIKATLNFANYNSYDLNDTYHIVETGKIIITFNVSENGGKWGEKGQSQDKVSSQIKVSLEQKTFKDFKDTVKDYVDPKKIGYTFDGWYSASTGGEKYEDNTQITMSQEECFTVYAQFIINSHTISLDGNGGTPSVTSISDVDYGTLLTTAVSDKTATHTDAAFKGWGLDSASQDIISTETMPDSDLTLYAIWNKYTFKFVVPTTNPHGSVSGTTEYVSKITLSNSDITNLVVTPNEGYNFTGKFKVYVDEETTERTTIDFSTTTLKPGKFDTPVNKDCTIKLEPEFSTLSYDVSFTYSQYEHLTSDDPIEVAYGSKILDTTLPTATHDFAKFNSWKDNDGTIITKDTTMPAKAITLRPTWDNYTINIVVDNGSSSVTQFTNKIEVSSDEFSITPNDGYIFNDKYQYSMDGVTYKDLSSTPFRPYALDSSITNGQQVYLKAVCEVKPAETVDVVLYAGEGSFTGGDQKTVTVVKNKTWSDIKASAEVIAWTSDLTPPTSKEFDHWSLEPDGSEISDSFTFDDDVMLFAVYADEI